ncbi:MAG: hypothetical protein M0Z82_02645, partial [Actinomycetota bacterium]|nr:hypothetical protein [Actinomycetota bacterium]
RSSSGARSSYGARCAAHLSAPPRQTQAVPAVDRRATSGDACSAVHQAGVLLQEDEARAIETLAGAGLIGALRFVPRRTG